MTPMFKRASDAKEVLSLIRIHHLKYFARTKYDYWCISTPSSDIRVASRLARRLIYEGKLEHAQSYKSYQRYTISEKGLGILDV